MLIQTPQPNAKQLQALQTLIIECTRVDNAHIPVYQHILEQARPGALNLLWFEEERLTGFLTTFFFYHDAFEIALMIAPDARQKGLATFLLRKALDFFNQQPIQRLIFSTPHAFGEAALRQYGFEYENSEYEMCWDNAWFHPPAPQPLLTTRLATLADVDKICLLDEDAFPNKTNMPERIIELMSDADYFILMLEKNGTIVGKAHLHNQTNKVYFSDIAITPSQQRKGYGSFLLAECIQYASPFAPKKLVLTVETTNRAALKLYTQLGFVIHNAYDFWQIDFARFQTYFNR